MAADTGRPNLQAGSARHLSLDRKVGRLVWSVVKILLTMIFGFSLLAELTQLRLQREDLLTCGGVSRQHHDQPEIHLPVRVMNYDALCSGGKEPLHNWSKWRASLCVRHNRVIAKQALRIAANPITGLHNIWRLQNLRCAGIVGSGSLLHRAGCRTGGVWLSG